MPIEQLVFLILAAITIFAFVVMFIDKRKFISGGSTERIPEGTLFLLAAALGSLGVYLRMILLRHKTRKWYFQIGIPLLLLQNCSFIYLLYILNE